MSPSLLALDVPPEAMQKALVVYEVGKVIDPVVVPASDPVPACRM